MESSFNNPKCSFYWNLKCIKERTKRWFSTNSFKSDKRIIDGINDRKNEEIDDI